HARLPQIAPFVHPRLSLAGMRRCRYQLCLAGFDVGTNFTWAAQSNAVVLKEEAGWEVYYSALFSPWEHYIPVAAGCADLAERLDWARRHPAACIAMSAAARAVVAELSDFPAQREMMRRVAAALPAVPPPFDP
ncbi:MAG TPA: glycosyl transferase family 90, partial [Paracoccus sp. (in: a-proteobacteria)]|nr:glycosyl transferase family 90 [Paracoccus sp. (in: a-proteobacteria)]